MPLFGKSSKSPNEVVRILKDDLLILEKGGENKKLEKVLNTLFVVQLKRLRVIWIFD